MRLLRASAATSRLLNADLVAKHGLTINDFEALLLLSHAEDGMLRRIDLAGSLALTPSGVTRLLDGLEAQGLVDKASCKSDARVTYARLTDAGRQRLGEAADTHVAQVRSIFEHRFDAGELATLTELLGRLPGGDVRALCA